ncbi:MAG: hypothetical protein GF334_06245 [Candidatus Altiarchaeales archaeon]|nr:hypothetical protein [Candidatus Altiarchaeales archaeon]
MTPNNRPRNNFRRPPTTLYKSQDDMMKALFATIDLLQGKIPEAMEGKEEALKIGSYVKDEEGFYSIDAITEAVQSLLPYINRNHIVELYFKDRDRKILINGSDRIKYKEVRYVKPPDTLYFGTIENLVDRMREGGLRSTTKGYVKLYDTPEGAFTFGGKFATREGDKVVALAVDAGAAFTDGLKFSTYIKGEYIAVRVDKKYLKSETVSAS